MPSSDGLIIEGLTGGWAGTTVLDRVSFRLAPGEFVTLMGPNGSGKTTLLRSLTGLEAPSAGSIRLDGRDLWRVPTHRRGIGLVFQEPTLLPRRTVWENIAYGPQLLRWKREEIDRAVEELLTLLHLGALADRDPEALSGGERQRVALARTLAPRPSVVLLDEPFASVDVELRTELRSEFRSVLRGRSASVLHVTHDREEGLFLGDRVLLLIGGHVVQEGSAPEVYRHPASASVAAFLGFNVIRRDGHAWAVAPGQLRCSEVGGGGPSARVTSAGFVGEGQVIYLAGPNGEHWESRAPNGVPLPAPGAQVELQWAEAELLPG